MNNEKNLSSIPKRQRDIILIFGKTGSGKTTLAKSIISKYSRVVIIDSQMEYDGNIVYTEQELVKAVIDNPSSFNVVMRLKEKRDNLFKVLRCITNYLLVVEELSLYCSPYFLDDDLQAMFAYGRHWKQSILAISQRPAQVHRMTTAQANIIYSFSQTEPRDMAYLNHYGLTGLNDLPLYNHKSVTLN